MTGEPSRIVRLVGSPVGRKRSWDALVASLPVPMVTVHRNELPADIAPAVSWDRLPAVYAVRADGSAVELVGPQQLRALDGSVYSFGALVSDRLTAGTAEPMA